jgi:hypothetical protein
VKILTNHKAKLFRLIATLPLVLLISFVPTNRHQHWWLQLQLEEYHIIIRNENAKTQQRNMNSHLRPATEALDHSARIGCSREVPPRTTAIIPSSSLKFDMTKLFHAAISMQQQQDSMQFPVIAWLSDDDENESASSDNTSRSDLWPDKEKNELMPSCKLTTKRGLSKRPREDSEGTHRMVRSKAINSDLSLLSSSFSTSRNISTRGHSFAAQ